MCSPIRSSTTDRAKRFGSRGRVLLARVGIANFSIARLSIAPPAMNGAVVSDNVRGGFGLPWLLVGPVLDSKP
jgi:hypothetical protein